MKIFEKLGDFLLMAKTLSMIGLIHERMDRMDEALECQYQALRLFQNIGDTVGECKTLNNLAQCLEKNQRIEEAVEKREQALSLLRDVKAYDAEFELFLNLGSLYGQLKRSKDRLNCNNEAVQVARKIGDPLNEASALNNLGLAYEDAGQYLSAIHSFSEAMEICKNNGFKSVESAVMTNIVYLYRIAAEKDSADSSYSMVQQLLRETRIHGYAVIISLVLEALTKLDNAGDGGPLFDAAEIIAKVYLQAFHHDGPYQIVQTYRKYSRDEIRTKTRAEQILGEGYDLYQSGSFKAAHAKWDQALDLFMKIDDQVNISKLLGNLGVIFGRAGKYSQSLNYFSRAIEASEGIDDRSAAASHFLNLGNLYYVQGDFSSAEDYYRRALVANKECRDLSTERSVLIGLADIYEQSSDLDQALEYCAQAAEVSRKMKDAADEVGQYLHIGRLYQKCCRYSDALAAFRKALSIADKNEERASNGEIISAMGSVSQVLGMNKQALDFYLQALSIAKKDKDERNTAAVLCNLGNVQMKCGLLSDSLSALRQALDISLKIKASDLEADILINLGVLHKYLAKDNEALEYYQRALDSFKKTGDRRSIAIVLGNIGFLSIHVGQYDQGVRHILESLSIAKDLADLDLQWKAQTMLAATYTGAGHREKAAAHYQEAIDTIEKIYEKSRELNEVERSSLMEDKLSIHKKFIELLSELYKEKGREELIEKAFVISEISKSRHFQEMVNKARARTIFAGNDKFAGFIENDRHITSQITHIRNRMSDELSQPIDQRNEELVDILSRQITYLEMELDKLKGNFKENFPRYYTFQYVKAVSIKDIQKVLALDEAVLSYAVCDKACIAFVITRHTFEQIDLSINKDELLASVKDLRCGLDEMEDLADLARLDPKLLYTLCNRIFSPVVRGLNGKTKVFVSADDLLYTVPFEALVDRDFDKEAFLEARRGHEKVGAEFELLHYLIDTYTFIYLPTVSILHSLRTTQKPGYGKWKKQFIAFADPIFSENEIDHTNEENSDIRGLHTSEMKNDIYSDVNLTKRSTGVFDLARLAETAEEARHIAASVHGWEDDIYLRERATEENVYIQNLQDARYILFATHGLLGGEFREFGTEPALLLTLVDNPPGTNGLLTMSKVMRLDLTAELVILSACNTYGKGEKAGGGEGFAGLARSFMYAGAASVIVTHWSVESTTTKEIIVEMFREKEKMSAAEALRQSKLALKNQGTLSAGDSNSTISCAHPFFWAPFVIVGHAG